MKRTRTTLRVVLSGALAGAVGLVQSASGQDGRDAPAGVRAVLDYSAGIDVDSNYNLEDESPGTYSAFVNGLNFALRSNTRNQSFDLRFGTELRFQSNPADPDTLVDWTDPVFRVLYSRESASSRLSLSGNVSVRQVDTAAPFFIDSNGVAIVDENVGTTGTLTNLGARFTLETGLNAPIGTTYSGSYGSRTYNDTDDPSLRDRMDYSLRTRTRLRFSPVTTGTVDLSASEYEYSGGNDEVGQDYSVSLGVIQEFSPLLTGRLSLGFAKAHQESDEENGTVTTTNHGLIGTAHFTKELERGSIYGDFSRELLQDAFRNTLSFGRTLQRQGYSLNGSIGLANIDGGDTLPTFSLSVLRDLPDGRLRATLRRTVTVNTDNANRELTGAVLSYTHEINDLSSFRLSADYTLVTRYGDETGGDDQRATFTASYQHALTEDWAMTVGYRGRTRSKDSGDAVSNAVFVNVGRQFMLR